MANMANLPLPKSLDWDEKFEPQHTLFYRDIKICRHLCTFWTSVLGQKQCFLGTQCTITWCLTHVLLSLICKFAITREDDAFVAKIENTLLTKIFMPIFALAERLPTSATLTRWLDH